MTFTVQIIDGSGQGRHAELQVSTEFELEGDGFSEGNERS